MTFRGQMKGKLAKLLTGKRKAKMSATGRRQPYRCQADGCCADTCLKNASDCKGKECGHPCRNSQPWQSRRLRGACADLHRRPGSLFWCCDRFITGMRVHPSNQFDLLIFLLMFIFHTSYIGSIYLTPYITLNRHGICFKTKTFGFSITQKARICSILIIFCSQTGCQRQCEVADSCSEASSLDALVREGIDFPGESFSSGAPVRSELAALAAFRSPGR